MPRQRPPQYLEANQTRLHEPTDYELALSAALEAAFSDGVTELADLVRSLNDRGVRDRNGNAWTEDSFAAEMADLGG